MGDDCIFCKIVAGEIPATKVFEDQACVASLDIGPLADGHVLVIPKTHAATLDEMTAEDAGAMLRNLPALAKAVRAATGCQGLNILQNNGTVAHQVVMHVHFHIIPRTGGDAFCFNWPAGEYPPGRMEQLARDISENLPDAADPAVPGS
jgi:histidine triad (HIT) family protein